MSFIDLLATLFGKISLGLVLIASGTTFTYPSLPALPPGPLLHFAPSFSFPHAPTSTPVTEVAKMPEPSKPVVIISPQPSPTTTTTPVAEVPKPLPVPKPAPVAPIASTPPVSTPETTQPAPVPENLGNVNETARAALVNILCVTGGAGPLRPISGSGIIISPNGVVLTNAHVAQFLLLKNYPVEGNVQCVLRTGSPARVAYTAELLYFPTKWMTDNAQKIVAENPTGTGENDFALLRITGTTDKTLSLPSSFPYVAPYTGEDVGAASVILAAYPAGFIDGATIQTNLYIASARTTVGEVFTFIQGGGADLFSVGGTILSQKGSSGGAVVRESDGKLIGLIVTATQAATTAERDLRAVTLHHITQRIEAELGMTLTTYISSDVAHKAAVFNLTVAPTLTRLLVGALNQ